MLAPVVLGTMMALCAHTSLLERLENLTMDMRFRVRAPEDPPADSRLLLIGIDQASLDRFGRWPWPRERHGDLCKLLAVNDPAVVAFDLLFTDVQKGNPEDDAYFAEAVKASPNVVTGALTIRDANPIPPGSTRSQPIPSIQGDRGKIPGNAGALVPFPALGAVSWTGFVDCDPGGDGVRRNLPLLLRVGDEVYPSLALQTL